MHFNELLSHNILTKCKYILEFQIWVKNIRSVKKDGRGALIKRQNRILTSRRHFIIKTQHLSFKLAPNPKTVFTLISMGTATGDVTAQKNERTPKDGKRQLCSELSSAAASIGTENEVKTSSVIAALA